MAEATWRSQPWQDRPVKDSDLGRFMSDGAGTIPYIRDIIDFGVNRERNSDIAVYTNADICVRSDCAAVIAAMMQETDALYSFRRDFREDFLRPKPDAEIERGEDYSGSDLYAFRVSWWRSHRPTMPDMLVSREAWDAVLRVIIDSTNPEGKTCVHNLIYHRLHDSVWQRPENRTRLPTQKYNVRLALNFCRKNGLGNEWGLPVVP